LLKVSNKERLFRHPIFVKYYFLTKPPRTAEQFTSNGRWERRATDAAINRFGGRRAAGLLRHSSALPRTT
jgi:hypothetical protein